MILTNSAGNLLNANCVTGGGWYDFTLSVDGGAGIAACGGAADGTDITGFSSLTITSADNDAWSDGVTITIDVAVYTPPSCLDPADFTATPISPTEIELSWTNGQDATPYSIACATCPSPTYTGTTGTTTTTTTISGLTADTPYSFDLFEDCTPNGTSATLTAATTTYCTAITTMPFLETFNTTSTTRDCWTQEYVQGTNNWTFVAGAQGGLISAAQSGDANARFTSTGGAEERTKLVSPILDISGLSAPELTYWYGHEFWSPDQNTHLVDYRTSPTSAWVNLVPENTTNASSWTENASVPLPSPSATYQLAFEGFDTFGRATVIDEVLVTDPPTCLDPSAASASATSATAIDVTWTSGNAAAATYNIVCATCPASPYTGTLTGAAGTVQTVSITGLTPNTAYSFDINEDCTPTTGGTSFSVNATASTPCLTYVAPFTEDFEASSATRDCWTNEYVAGTSDWFFSTGNGAAVSNAWSGVVNARFTQSGFPDDTTIFVSPELDITGLGSPSLFYGYSQEFWAPDQNVLRVFEKTSAAGAWTLIYDHTADGDVAAWTENQVGGLTSSATYYLGFEASDVFGRAVTLDSVRVLDQPICATPSGLTCTVLSDTEIRLDWTNGQDATAYEIVCAACPGTPYAGTTSNDGSGTTSVTISGLTAATAYSFDVTEQCGGLAGDSPTISCGSTTLCSAIATMPFYEDFETTSTTRPCWIQEYVTGTQDWTYATGAAGGLISVANNGILNARFTSSGTPFDTTMLISPVLDLTSLTVIELSFAYAQEEWFGDQNMLGVKYRTSHTGPWVDVTTFTGNVNAWTQESLILPAGANTASTQIGFEGTDLFGRRIVLDDVQVDEAPPCIDPSSYTATVLSDTEVELCWTNGQDNTPYVISCIGCPGTPYSGTTSNDGSGTTCDTITGLTAETAYTFSMYEDCAAGGGFGVSATVNATVTTDCAPFVAPYTESFDVTTLPTCWDNYATTGGPWVFNQSFLWNSGGCPGAPSDNTGNGGRWASMDMSFTDVAVVLEMNAVDVSALTTPLLQFYHFMCADGYTPHNETHVEYWDGSAWGTIAVIDTGYAAWTKYEYDLTAFTYGTNLVRCRFRAESGGSGTDFWGDIALDDVSIIETPTCPDPTGIAVSNQTETGFDVTFTPGTIGSTGYVEYGAPGFLPGAGTTTAGVTTTASTTISISGLTGGTLYDFYVYEDCQPVTLNSPDLSLNIGPTSTYTLGNPTACGINVDIPDNSGGVGCAEVQLPVTVTGTSMGFDIELKEVDIIIRHTWDSDLDIELEDPHGVIVELSTDNGGAGDDYGVPFAGCATTTTFSMTASSSITTGGAPFPSSYIPEGDFDDFNTAALDPNGTWTLRVCDDAGGDVGFIEFVELTFGDPPGCPNDPTNVALSNFTETSIDWTFDTDNDGTGTPTTWYVEYAPSPATQGAVGNDTIFGTHSAGPGTTISGTASGLAPGAVYDFFFFENCGTAFNSNVIGAITGYTLGNPTACGLNQPLSAANPVVTVNIPVSGYPGEFLGVNRVVGEVKVLIDHEWDGDLDITLESPDGIVVDLSSDNGGAGDDYGDPTDATCNTTANFRDDATVAVTAGSPNYTTEAAYIPEQPLADFNGLTNVVDGTWILTITDDFPSLDDGTFEHAEIVFELPPPCQDPQNLASTATGQTTLDFSWFSWNAGSTWTLEYGPVGFTPGSGIGTVTGTSVLGAGNTGQITGLTAGTAYDVYVSEDCGGGDVSGDVGPVTVATRPLNDECADAILIGVSNQGYCQSFELGSNVGATPVTASGVGDPSCANYDGGDIWFQLTVPPTGDVTIMANNSTPTGFSDGGMAVYDACGGTELGCNDDGGPGLHSQVELTGQTPGATLYVRYWEWGNNATGTFNICAFEPTTNAPINNFPCNAFTLNTVNDCNYVLYANQNATTSTTGSCSSGARDVWFKTVVPASGTVVLNTVDFSIGDATMTVHTMTDCSNSGTWSEVACSDDEGIGLMPYIYIDGDDGISPNDTLYIRVAGFSNFDEGVFQICATEGIVWDGSTSTSFTTGSNWFQGGPGPDATENMIVSSNASNDLIVTSNQSAKEVWVHTGAAMSVTAGDIFSVTGNLNTGGSNLDFGDGTVQMNGTSAQSIVTSFGTLDFGELLIDNATGVTLSPATGSGIVNINGVLDISGGSLDGSAGNIRLISDASGDAYLDNWNSATNATTGTFIGDITVQRYIGAPGYHHIGPGGIVDPAISQLNMYNLAGADGVQVTPIDAVGAACVDTTLAPGSNYGPVFQWDENNSGFGSGCPLHGWTVRSSGGLLTGRGYAAQNLSGGGAPFTINWTGSVQASPASYGGGALGSTGGGGYHLVSNPFASPVTWGAGTGMGTFCYMWNDGTGTYSAFPPGGVVIAIGQGFFTQVAGGGNTFTMDNSFRTETNTPTFFRRSTIHGDYSVNLEVSGNGFSHFTVIGFADEFWGATCSNGWDQGCDAYALPSASGQPFMFSQTTEEVIASPNRLQYNTQSLLEGGSRSVPVVLDPGANGQFTITATDLESFPAGTTITLEDTKEGVTQDLIANPTYTFTGVAADYDPNNPIARFIVHFNAAITDVVDADLLSANYYVSGENLVMDLSGNNADAVKGVFSILNAVGQDVISSEQITTSNGRHTTDVSGLANGVYIVRFITDGKTYSGRFVKH